MQVRGVKKSKTGYLIVPNWNYLYSNGKELPVMPETLQGYNDKYSKSLFINFRARPNTLNEIRNPGYVYDTLRSGDSSYKSKEVVYSIAKDILETPTIKRSDRNQRKFLASSIINFITLLNKTNGLCDFIDTHLYLETYCQSLDLLIKESQIEIY